MIDARVYRPVPQWHPPLKNECLINSFGTAAHYIAQQEFKDATFCLKSLIASSHIVFKVQYFVLRSNNVATLIVNNVKNTLHVHR